MADRPAGPPGVDQPTGALPTVTATGPRRFRPGRTLTARAVLVTCAVALVSVLVTAVVAVPLAVRNAQRQAQHTLAAQAQMTVEVLRFRLNRGRPTDDERLLRLLANQDVEAYLIRDGRVDRPGLPPQVVERVAAGRDVSVRRFVDGRPALVEGRALGDGNGWCSPGPGSPGSGGRCS